MSFERTVALFTGLQEQLHQAAGAVSGSAVLPCSRPSLRPGPTLESHLTHALHMVEKEGAGALSPDMAALLSDIIALHEGAAAAATPGGAAAAASRGSGGGLLPRVLLVSLHAALAARDYTAALNTLHAYFDHVQASAPQGPIALGEQPSTNAARAKYQSALLSLSALHTAFGHTQEAVAALNEALRLAQQHNDQWCLLHGLAGLCRLLSCAAPGAPGLPAETLTSLKHGSLHVQLLRLLRRCVERGHELKAPHITATARLALAKFHLLHTVQPSDDPAATPSSSTPALDGNGMQSGSGAGMADASSEEGVGGLAGRAGMFGEGWGRLGAAAAVQKGKATSASTTPGEGVRVIPPVYMAATARDVAMLHHAATLEAVGPDPPRTTAAAAAAASGSTGAAAAAAGMPVRGPLGAEVFSGPCVFPHASTRATAPAAAAATQQVVGSSHLLLAGSWLDLLGSSTLAATHTIIYLACYGTSARVDDTGLALAQVIANAAKHRGARAAQQACAVSERLLPNSMCRPLLAVRAGLRHDLALAHGDERAAEDAVGEVAAVADPAPFLDMDISVDAGRRRVQSLLLVDGAQKEAAQAAQATFGSALQAGMQAEAVAGLVQIAEVHLAAQDPPGALPYALSASLHASGRCCHDLTAAKCGALVSHCWHLMSPGHTLEVLQMMQDVSPLLLSEGGLQEASWARQLLAESLLDSTSAWGPECVSEQLRAVATPVVELLQGAVEGFCKLEAWQKAGQAAYILAHVYHSLGQTDQRDAAAAQFAFFEEQAHHQF